MADLAQGQGGSDVTVPREDQSAHAQSASSDINRMEAFVARGEKILDNFNAGVAGYEAMAKRFKDVENAVASLQKTAGNRKHRALEPMPGSSGGKKRKKDDATPPPIEVDVSDDSDESSSAEYVDVPSDDDPLSDIDNVLQHNEDVEVSTDFLQEVEEFFVAEQQCGANVHDGVANTINMALRGTINEEKMKAVWDRNKRPENVSALQIPRVPHTLWSQLTNHTKSLDASRQKMIGQSNQALIPIVKAMNHIKQNNNQDKTLITHISDTFKILASQVAKVNHERRDSIKQELTSQFKDLCSEDNPASATELFGDQYADKVKAMDQGKTVKMTKKSQSSSFLVGPGEQISKQDQNKTLPSSHRPYVKKHGFKLSAKHRKPSKHYNKTSKAKQNRHQKNNY